MLPGRVRLRNPILYYNKELARYINAYCDNLYGVKYSNVSHTTASILIEYDTGKVNLNSLKKSIGEAIKSAAVNKDWAPKPYEDYFKAVEKRNKAKRHFLAYSIIYLLLAIKKPLWGKFSLSRNVRVLQLAALVTIVGGYPVLKRLYKKFARVMPTDSDILLALAAASFTIMRESSKGVLVLVLKALSDYVKYSAEVECRRSLRQGMSDTAGMAWIKTGDGQELLVPVNSLSLDDIINIKKGEVIPAEGEIVDGKAIVNSLYYSGQPDISIVSKGNKVYEGITVLSGEIGIRLTKLPDDSNKEDILEEDLRIHRNVKWYTENIAPISIGAAVLNYLFTQNIMNAIAVLLVLSPSAAATALSSGIKNYISVLNKNDIYLKNPNILEKIRDIDSIVFDKTGTLTYGNMSIRDIVSFESRYRPADLLNIAAACEADNYHPISVTLKGAASERPDISKISSSVYLPSQGIVAKYENKKVLIGNLGLMNKYKIDVSKGMEQYSNYLKESYIPVFISMDKKLTGLLVMEERLREDAGRLIEELKNRKISDLAILTGDNYENARSKAAILKIDKVYANCSYSDKVRIIQEKKLKGAVMMVGDGINDVAAMREADASVTFANNSCDKIKLNSDCIIFEDDMARLSDLISLSKKSYRRINQSLLFSYAYNISLGAAALLRGMDAFAAKSLNTMNSLIVLLLNQRIRYLLPEKGHMTVKDTEDAEVNTVLTNNS
jgi:cation-transporting P-type ATPase C